MEDGFSGENSTCKSSNTVTEAIKDQDGWGREEVWRSIENFIGAKQWPSPEPCVHFVNEYSLSIRFSGIAFPGRNKTSNRDFSFSHTM